MKLGRLKGTLDVGRAQELLTQLTEVPKRVEEALQCETAVKRIARTYQGAQGFLFLGRGPMHPVALEGALKLKEISYIHAEVRRRRDEHAPSPSSTRSCRWWSSPPRAAHALREDAGNIERCEPGRRVIAVVDEEDTVVGGLADDVVRVPASSALLGPIVTAIPLQLLAYHVADLRGNDVDQPRNLAKSVTVE